MYDENGILSIFNKRRRVTEYVRYTINQHNRTTTPVPVKNGKKHERRWYKKDQTQYPARQVDVNVDRRKHMCRFHLITLYLVAETARPIANNMRNIILFNEKVNSGLWRDSEREDELLDDHFVRTDIHVGELRKEPDHPKKPECYKVVESGATLYNRIFKVRACLDARNEWSLWCYAFDNCDPPPGSSLRNFEVDLLDVWLGSGVDVMKEYVGDILHVNNKPFDVASFSKKLHQRRRNVFSYHRE